MEINEVMKGNVKANKKNGVIFLSLYKEFADKHKVYNDIFWHISACGNVNTQETWENSKAGDEVILESIFRTAKGWTCKKGYFNN